MTDRSAAGRVVGLRTFPVKSMDAVPLQSAQVLSTGLEHDRGWAVTDGSGAVMTARTAPDLREVRASAPDAAGSAGSASGPALVLPGSDLPVRGTSADAALSQLVGQPVAVRVAAGAGIGFQEVAAVHLVSRQSVQAQEAVARDAPSGDPACSVEEPRANVVLDLADGTEVETAWVGREVHLGDVVLKVTTTPRHCLGVYADVVRPGAVSVGDDVRLD